MDSGNMRWPAAMIITEDIIAKYQELAKMIKGYVV
jgi:hypothetical protein